MQGFQSHFCHCLGVNQSVTHLAETVSELSVETDDRGLDLVHIPPPNVTTDGNQPPPPPPAQRTVTISVGRLSMISSGSTVSVTSLTEGSKDKKDQNDAFNPFEEEELVSKFDHHAAELSLPQTVPVIHRRMNSPEMTIDEG